jgi:GNAT superfamily N-acetyltransferase
MATATSDRQATKRRARHAGPPRPERCRPATILWPCDAQARPMATAPPKPWTRYLAWADGQLLGGGGFTAPPRHGRVEIGYFTLPSQQRQGHGLRIARALLALAWAADPSLTVIAHTRRSAARRGCNTDTRTRTRTRTRTGTRTRTHTDIDTDTESSASILQRLGFRPPRAGRDARVGPVWRWVLRPPRPDRPPQAPTIGV